jgi:hypothetical protein
VLTQFHNRVLCLRDHREKIKQRECFIFLSALCVTFTIVFLECFYISLLSLLFFFLFFFPSSPCLFYAVKYSNKTPCEFEGEGKSEVIMRYFCSAIIA